MAFLAMRGSGAVNGVSRLHGRVSRHIFGRLFPRWPEDEVPVSHVTNGVHMPTWDSAAADELWTDACGKGCLLYTSLLPPNHYLCAMVSYLFQNRPKWPKAAAVGKTLVSSQSVDRIAAKLGRKLFEVPVGFKWFVGGLLDGSLAFGGEESLSLIHI